MFCATCGNQLVAGATFCGKCGTPAPNGQPTIGIAAPSSYSSTQPAANPAANPYATPGAPAAGVPGANPYAQASYMTPNPPKSFIATWLLAFFFGPLAVDRFYLGYVGLGLAKLFTFIGLFLLGLATFLVGGFILWFGLGVWALVDLILILAGKLPDANGRELEGYEQNKKVALWVTLGLMLGPIVLFVLFAVVSFVIAAGTIPYGY